MASTEPQPCHGSEEKALSFHGAQSHYPTSTDSEDVADLRHDDPPAEVVESHVQPAQPPIATDSEIARRALDLMVLRDNDDDDVDHGQIADDRTTHYDNGGVIGEDDETTTSCPAGKMYLRSEAAEIEKRWLGRYSELYGQYVDAFDEILSREDDDDDTPLPPAPLKVFPHATALCILDSRYCYHTLYNTHDTSTTSSFLGYRTPKAMLQFFYLCLSGSGLLLGPVSVYGIVAVRDDLEPRRNYVFNRDRDDAVTIEKPQQQEPFDLPLCSPCRGMYVIDLVFVEVDLWVKNEGDGSSDKQLLSAYAETEIRAHFDDGLGGRISNDVCNLDIGFVALARSVEAVIEVYAKVDDHRPQHLRFTGLSTGYCDEIVLFDGKFSGDEKLFQHIVAVKASEQLDVILRVDGLTFRWTFHGEHVGPVSSPDGDKVVEYGQFFVRVFFAPKNSEGKGHRPPPTF